MCFTRETPVMSFTVEINEEKSSYDKKVGKD